VPLGGVLDAGQIALRPEQIEQLIEILGISPDYLFGKTKKLTPKNKSS
jgi:hypothetical protein